MINVEFILLLVGKSNYFKKNIKILQMINLLKLCRLVFFYYMIIKINRIKNFLDKRNFLQASILQNLQEVLK